jgi:hypothetical protein
LPGFRRAEDGQIQDMADDHRATRGAARARDRLSVEWILFPVVIGVVVVAVILVGRLL